MTELRKKGDFQPTSGQSKDAGGNKKAHARSESNSRTADKQNAGRGSRTFGTDD